MAGGGGKAWLLRSATTMLFCVSFCFGQSLNFSDTISSGQSLYSYQTIISEQGKFELGFFSPGNSSNVYVGIWYKFIPERTVVWVANRVSPIPSHSFNSSRLSLLNGYLGLYSSNTTIWMTASELGNATEATLLDNGNLVLTDGAEIVWQSFDYPTDTWLPGGKVGLDKITNRTAMLTSWRNPIDPGLGLYSLGVDPVGGGEFFIWRNGSQRYWRSGNWIGGDFPFLPEGRANPIYNFSYISTDEKKYLVYNSYNESIASRIVIGFQGVLQLMIWTERTQTWVMYLNIPNNQCQVYAVCGAFGLCDISSSPLCNCLPGFEPRLQLDWSLLDFSGGCIRKNALQCDKNKVGYTNLPNIKFPANSEPLEVGRDEICEFACSLNCSCLAYAYSSNGGCLLWFRDLLDLEQLQNGTTDGVLHVKLYELHAQGKKKQWRVALPLAIACVVLICGASASCRYLWKRKLKYKGIAETSQNLLLLNIDPKSSADSSALSLKDNKRDGESKNYELPVFSFSSITAATGDFSIANKLGEGGFGPVYMGKLLNGESVAVKRLSTRSGQGMEEFRNETKLIAKLQHRNLVRILGCCTEQDEKIVVYEYVCNKSLDSFLFDHMKKDQLDWRSRVQIIEGIAQGLLYLHQYSRLRIVHRDLKASNILLDGDMIPKISDFGMARILGENELQANTMRIVGTYGYMSPEYAMEGRFSVKSDVFAFGVLLLEIISGKKNTGFYGSDCLNLLGHAWELWINGKATQLLDQILQIPSTSSVALRYVTVGLLCVQEHPADRPTMAEVVTMLCNDQTTLVSPKQPAFTAGRNALMEDSGGDKAKTCSVNNVTISLMEPR